MVKNVGFEYSNANFKFLLFERNWSASFGSHLCYEKLFFHPPLDW